MRWVRLGDVFEINRGGSPRPISKYVTKSPDGVNWIKISDTDDSRYISKTKEKIIHDGVSKSRRVEPGDFLLTNSMSFGRPYISQIEGCIHDGWLVLKPVAQNVMEDYLYHYLSSDAAMREFIKKAKGTTVKNLNISLVKDVQIPLPSLSEQRAIVERLDRAQRLIDIDREMLQRYDDLIQSVFLDMFGDPVRNPKGWEVRKLGSLVEEFRYGTSNKSSGYGTPVLGIPNILYGNVDVSTVNKTELSSIELEKLILRQGDILFVRTNGNPDYIGRCWAFNIDGNYAYASYLIRARVIKRHIYPEFLTNLLQTKSGRRMIKENAKTSAGQYNINTKGLGSLEIIVPPIENQAQFLKKLGSIKSHIRRVQDELQKSDYLFSSLVQKAFSKN